MENRLRKSPERPSTGRPSTEKQSHERSNPGMDISKRPRSLEEIS